MRTLTRAATAAAVMAAAGLLAVSVASADDDEYLPTPFRADQIRDASPVGRKLEFEVEASGQPKRRSLMEFVAVTDDTGTVRTTTLDADGKQVGEPSQGEDTWENYRDHARFFAASTKMVEGEVEVPAGRFACKIYTSTRKVGEKEQVRRFWFALDLPGPPVKMEVSVDGARVFSMTLVKHTPGK